MVTTAKEIVPTTTFRAVIVPAYRGIRLLVYAGQTLDFTCRFPRREDAEGFRQRYLTDRAFRAAHKQAARGR